MLRVLMLYNYDKINIKSATRDSKLDNISSNKSGLQCCGNGSGDEKDLTMGRL